MHIRFSTAVGLQLVEETEDQPIATVSGILLHPDLGKVEGFFVRVPSFFRSEELFLATLDIVHWGKRIRIRSGEVLSPAEEFVRLHPLLQEKRTILHQKIVAESGQALGVCRDVQFDTHLFLLEWIFPRKVFRWMRPIPASSIVIVREDAIIVRDAVMLPDVATGPSVLETIDPLGRASMP